MLSNTSKYAVRALIYLGIFAEKGEKIGIKKISSDLKIPSPFLGKILQSLVKSKILCSTKGPNGGFGLGKDAENITLYDIIKTIDGEDFFTNCLVDLNACLDFRAQGGKACTIHCKFCDVRKEIRDFYKQTTLALVAAEFGEKKELLKM